MKRLIAITAFLFAFTPAHADFTKGAQTLTIFGGLGGSNSEYDFEPGDKEVISGGGGAFGAQYLYFFTDTPSLAIGVDVSSSLNGTLNDDEMLNGYDTSARLKSRIALLIGRLTYPKGKIRPYLFAGMGAHDSSQTLTATPKAGNSWLGGGSETRVLVDKKKTSFALGYGIGVDIFPTESFFFGAELRGTWLAALDTEDTAAVRAAGFTDDDEDVVSQGNLYLRAGLRF